MAARVDLRTGVDAWWPSEADDDRYQERGDSYGLNDDAGPRVTRPIGFMRRKPRVRVKAWTCPIIKET